MQNLDPLFMPRSIAIIGASTNLEKISGRPLDSLMRHGFTGSLYPVNPGASVINGVRCWPDIASIPESFETAFIALPSGQVHDAIVACAARGAKAVVVYSSGFSEGGAAGQERQAQLIATCKAHHIRLAGPNCLGIMNMRDRIMLTASTAPTALPLPAGQIGLVSQSGALAGALLSRGAERGIAFRYAVASGNEADVDMSEYLDWMLQDPQVRVLAALFEGLVRPRAFIEVCRRASARNVPVVVCRIGRSVAGQLAAASHTGSMLSDERAFEAVARSLGVAFVDDLDGLVESAGLLCQDATRRGIDHHLAHAGVAVISHSGGGAILLTDLLAENGLSIASFSTTTCMALQSVLPDWGSAQNPLDLTTFGLNDAQALTRSLHIIAADPGVSALALVMSNTAAASAAQHEVLRDFQRSSPKPVVVYVIDGVARRHMQSLREEGIAVFDSATALTKALRATLCRSIRLADVAAPDGRAAAGDGWCEQLRCATQPLTEPEAKSMLAAAGIASPPGRQASDAASARAAAEQLGYPVVLKLVSAGVHHKSEIGGVIVGLQDGVAVEAAAARIVQNARAHLPEGTSIGLLVEHMMPLVAELIIGVRRSPDFGVVVLVGLGGIYAEFLHDTIVRAAPVTPDDARAMLAELKAWPLLTGARNQPAADIDAAAEAIARLSQLAVMLDDTFAEMEINPLGLGRSGALALDALIVPAQLIVKQETREH